MPNIFKWLGTRQQQELLGLIPQHMDKVTRVVNTLAQGIDLLQYQQQMSEASKWFYQEIRHILPFFREDQPAYASLNQIKDWLKTQSGNPLSKAEYYGESTE